MVFSILYSYFYGNEKSNIKEDEIISIDFSLTPYSMVKLPNNKV